MNFSPAASQPAFELGNEWYHCKHCDKYTSNFCRAFVRRKYRMCRACLKLRRGPEPQTPLGRLRRLLYKSLHGKGFKDYARALSCEVVQDILDYHGVEAKDVARIVPPKLGDRLIDPSSYRIVSIRREGEST